MPEWLKAFLFEWCHLVTMLSGRGIIYMLIGGIITAAQVNNAVPSLPGHRRAVYDPVA